MLNSYQLFLLLWVNLEENYQQLLAKALAHYFQAKLLLLDVTDFSLKVSTYKKPYTVCTDLYMYVLFLVLLMFIMLVLYRFRANMVLAIKHL